MLDMVIVVAGAPKREEIVFRLIKLAQNRLPLPTPTSKRPRLSPPSSIESPYILRPIPRLSTPPPFETFASLLDRPFIISGGCKHWPALTDPAHNWRSMDYLREVAGRGRVVPVEKGKHYSDQNWTQEIIPFESFLRHIESTSDSSGETLYLAQHDLFRQFPELSKDIEIPDYVYSAPESTFEGYVPPSHEEGYIMNAWFGPGGSISPAHTDPYFNCFGSSFALSLSGRG